MTFPDYDLSVLHLEALHHYGFTVTIHSPKTSRDGVYDVTAYGLRDEQYNAKAEHLTDAIQKVAAQLGVDRLHRFMYDRNMVALLIGAGGDL